MCGLFGMIRNPKTTIDVPETLHALGTLSVERGRDSAGLAYLTPDGHSLITARPGIFNTQFAAGHLGHAEHAAAILGHTRWATQGNTTDPANMSPMPVGDLIGTHNGDVDTRTIPDTATLPSPRGGTDTERLYQRLATESGLEAIAKVLSIVQGRAALAWTDARTPQVIYLARMALSPLATARDLDGNLFWASNPDWFRTIESRGLTTFTEITLIPEGTVNAYDVTTGDLVETATFTPTCRAKDLRLLDVAVWRGFTPSDRATDREGFRHLVAPAPTTATTTGSWARDSGRWDYLPPTFAEESEDFIPDAEDEALDFMINWMETGCNDATCQAFLAADRRETQWTLAEQYDLTDAAVVVEIRAQMTEWMGYDLIEG